MPDEIVPDNLHAVQAISFSWHLEQLRLFDVADRIAELWAEGLLPVGRGEGGTALETYRRGSRRRLSRAERLAVYARCFESNRDFDELWLRFLRAVSSYRRQRTVENVLAAKRAASREAVRTTGRDLAANLSLHGFGLAPTAASLDSHAGRALDVLRTGAVRRAYGSRDVWATLELVSMVELGRVASTVRGRTSARAGGTIVRWLATRSVKLSSRGAVLDPRDLRRLRKSATPLESPTDLDLIDACELWLAVGRVPDRKVERSATPDDARTRREVRAAVDRLLSSSTAFAHLPPAERASLARDMVKVASFMATPHDDGCKDAPHPPDQPWWGLQDVDFPAFVTALVKGVFDAIVDASIEQLRSYAKLVESVTKAVDDFADDDGDDAARRRLAVTYPDVLALTSVERKAGRLTVLGDDRDDALGRIRADLCLRQRPLNLDDRKDEALLVGRARGRARRNRQQLLATMVLLGINRA